MVGATMSILGLYNYDNTIFDNMAFPMDDSEEQQNIIDNILLDCAELEVIYTNPDFIKWAIGTWSVHELPIWTRIYNASQAEYNPIENYDRIEETETTTDGTVQHSGNDSRRVITSDDTDRTLATDSTRNITENKEEVVDGTVQNSGNDVNTSSGTDRSTKAVDTTATNSGSDVTTNQIAAFNSSTLVDHDKSTLAHGHVLTTDDDESGSITYGKTDTLAHGLKTDTDTTTTNENTVRDEYEDDITEGIDRDIDTTDTYTHGEKVDDDTTVTVSSRIHGNIGVTTSQQMLEQEIELAPKINVCDYITNSFKRRFCLLVY